MKKEKMLIMAVLFFIGTSVAFGAVSVRQWIGSKRLADGMTQSIYSDVLDAEKIRVLKFQDDKTICYVAYVETNSLSYTPSLQCAIK